MSILSRAFDPDPVISHFLGGPLRGPAYRIFFADVVLAQRTQGQAYVLDEGSTVLGVALWTPPEAPAPTAIERLRSRAFAGALRLLSPSGARELSAGFERASHLHPLEPHWYLAFVGIDPAHQGRGHGERLLAPILARADREQRPAYLETPFPRTHAFYRRLGFEVTRELRPFRGAPPVWTMFRSPRPT